MIEFLNVMQLDQSHFFLKSKKSYFPNKIQ